MIQRLRKKFIRMCMAACTGAFLVLFFAILGITSLQMSASLDALADLIAQNGGRFPALSSLDAAEPPPGTVNQESPFTTRFFTVAFGADGTVAQVDVGAVASVTEEEAAAYGEAALAAGKERGWMDDFRYRVYQGAAGTAAVFLSGAEAKAANQRFLMGACAVLLGGCLVALLLAALFSRQAVRPTAEAYEKQKRFITDASHALKTPLTLLQADLEILESEQGPDPWRSDMQEAVSNMTALVERLVALCRMDEAGEALPAAPFDLSEAAGEAAAAFSAAAARQGKALQAHIDPGVTYVGDRRAIGELLAILLDNGVKYCDPGGTVQLHLRGGKHPTLRVENAYAQAGRLDVSRIFDRFYRGDDARACGSGFGIGLSMAKAIVAQHKGTICARSQGGNTVILTVRL